MSLTQSEAESAVDIHGTDYNLFQQVLSATTAETSDSIVLLRLSQPLTVAQLTTLMEHLRTWHP